MLFLMSIDSEANLVDDEYEIKAIWRGVLSFTLISWQTIRNAFFPRTWFMINFSEFCEARSQCCVDINVTFIEKDIQ